MCSCIGGHLFFFYDGRDAYVTKQENDHYVYHNAAMTVTISNGCLTSTTIRECLLDEKAVQEECELIGGSILARVDCA